MNMYKAKNKKEKHLYSVKGWKREHINSQGIDVGGEHMYSQGVRVYLCVVMVRGTNAC